MLTKVQQNAREVGKRIRAIRSQTEQLKAIAEQYQVDLRFDDSFEDDNREGWGWGPISARCNPLVRCVEGAGASYEDVLHELVHVIVYIPTPRIWSRGIEKVDETKLLIPFERALADVVVASKARMKAVVRYQESTVLNPGMSLREYNGGDYLNSERWKRATMVARKVGLLDKYNYPTFRNPNWKRLSHRERRWLFF